MVRVCVADDDQDIRGIVAEFLQDEGFEVETFDGGAELLGRVQAAADELVVLFDLTMPGMSGRDFLAALAAYPALTVRHRFLLMTAWGKAIAPEVDALLLQTGVPVIEKPFPLATLLEAVEAAARSLEVAGADPGAAGSIPSGTFPD